MQENSLLSTLKSYENTACGTDIKRFKPNGLTSQAVELSNTIYRYFANKDLKYGDTEYRLSQLTKKTTQSEIWISLRCELGEIHIGIGRVVLAAIVENAVCGVALDNPEEDLMLSVIEVACDRWLTALESEIGSAVILSKYTHTMPENIATGVDLAFSIEVADVVIEELRIVCSESLVAPLAKVLCSFYEEFVSEKNCEAVSLTLRSMLGSSELLYKEFALLESGDVILITSPSCTDLNKIRISVGARHYIVAEYHRKGFSITLSEEGNIMNEIENRKEYVNGTDRLSIHLDFDIGSTEVLVEELSQLTEGHVLRMNQPTDAPVNIRCGTHLVGRGELLEIDGEILAVRVVQLYGQSSRKLWASSRE